MNLNLDYYLFLFNIMFSFMTFRRRNIMKLNFFNSVARVTFTALFAVGALFSASVNAKDTIKVGVVSFLTGPAGGPFGVPAKQGAELVIDAINSGTMPAPYNTKGFAGATMNPIFSDESGGGTKQVALFRDFVQKQNVVFVKQMKLVFHAISPSP